MKFYLGVHLPYWLAKLDVPMFVSHRTLKRYVYKFPKAISDWALDSGGFSELSMYGRWVTSKEEYVDAVETYQFEIGKLEWAAIQDYMCEPFIVEKTGLSVREHQKRTVESFLALDRLNPEVEWLPVIQGFTLQEYLRSIRYYRDAGVDLTEFDTVGVGSICRRQGTLEAVDIINAIADEGIRIHGFGMKTKGLERLSNRLVSADSMAWSFGARRRKVKLKKCVHHVFILARATIALDGLSCGENEFWRISPKPLDVLYA